MKRIDIALYAAITLAIVFTLLEIYLVKFAGYRV